MKFSTYRRRQEILAVYQSERTDQQNSATLIIAVRTAALAYIGLAIDYLSQAAPANALPAWLWLGAAIPLLMLANYARFQEAASAVRFSYMVLLERHLRGEGEALMIPGYVSLHTGLFREGKIRNAVFISLAEFDSLSMPAISTAFVAYITAWLPTKTPEINQEILWMYRIFYLTLLGLHFSAIYQIRRFKRKRLEFLTALANETIESERQRWGVEEGVSPYLTKAGKNSSISGTSLADGGDDSHT